MIEPLGGLKPGRIQSLERDIGAIAMKGMHLAFQDCRSIPLSGTTLDGDTAERTVKVCGPGAFVVLKALAIGGRSEKKDAYDLFMVLRSCESGPPGVAALLADHRNDPDVIDAIAILKSNFAKPTDIGPSQVARFLKREQDNALRQDVVGHVALFFKTIGERCIVSLKAGDVVRLKSGSPDMTIDFIDTDPVLPPVCCSWFDKKKKRCQERFAPETLELV